MRGKIDCLSVSSEALVRMSFRAFKGRAAMNSLTPMVADGLQVSPCARCLGEQSQRKMAVDVLCSQATTDL
jgi:hypothetical protein